VFRVIFAIVFLLNLFLIMAGSSGAVPFGTLLLIVFLWFGISSPLSAVGSYYGAKHGVSVGPSGRTSSERKQKFAGN